MLILKESYFKKTFFKKINVVNDIKSLVNTKVNEFKNINVNKQSSNFLADNNNTLNYLNEINKFPDKVQLKYNIDKTDYILTNTLGSKLLKEYNNKYSKFDALTIDTNFDIIDYSYINKNNFEDIFKLFIELIACSVHINNNYNLIYGFNKLSYYFKIIGQQRLSNEINKHAISLYEKHKMSCNYLYFELLYNSNFNNNFLKKEDIISKRITELEKKLNISNLSEDLYKNINKKFILENMCLSKSNNDNQSKNIVFDKYKNFLFNFDYMEYSLLLYIKSRLISNYSEFYMNYRYIDIAISIQEAMLTMFKENGYNENSIINSELNYKYVPYLLSIKQNLSLFYNSKANLSKIVNREFICDSMYQISNISIRYNKSNYIVYIELLMSDLYFYIFIKEFKVAQLKYKELKSLIDNNNIKLEFPLLYINYLVSKITFIANYPKEIIDVTYKEYNNLSILIETYNELLKIHDNYFKQSFSEIIYNLDNLLIEKNLKTVVNSKSKIYS